MVKFLLNKPVSVIMTFLALVILGVISSKQLPVSLLPDVEIPEITVKLNYPDYNAREFEQAITQQLRRQIRQCSNVEDIKSVTEDGKSTITVQFAYGTNTELAAIEVNEKIDRQMTFLPRNMERPKVIKASVTDIPAFYMNVLFKEVNDRSSFVELSQVSQTLIKRRIEHLVEVSYVDVTGTQNTEIVITPDEAKLKSMGIDAGVLEQAFGRNNISLGSIQVEQGYYRYNIRFQSKVYTVDEIANIYFMAGGRLIQMREVARVEKLPAKREGLYFVNDQQAVSVAIFKQPDAQMQVMRESIDKVLTVLKKDFPQIQFSITQDQTELLDYSISNLKTSLILGMVLAVLIIFLFMANVKLPVLIGVTVPVSLVISLLFFMLMDISINIVSLSGLILGLGLMIDNSIIVIDNITQYWERKKSIQESCHIGTNEVIRPLLSSALTTSAVFIPLVFMSGLAGGLFYDQAIAVTIGLFVSFWVSVTLLPVLYFILFRKSDSFESSFGNKTSYLDKILPIENWYEKGINIVFRWKKSVLVFFLLLAVSSVALFKYINKFRFPELDRNDMMVELDWNENISLEVSKSRLALLFEGLDSLIAEQNKWLGVQDYYLNKSFDMQATQCKLYLRTQENVNLETLQEDLSARLNKLHPMASIAFAPAENIFESAFADNGEQFELRIYPENTQFNYDSVYSWVSTIKNYHALSASDNMPVKKVGDNKADMYFAEYYSVSFNFEKLLLYGVGIRRVINELQRHLNNFEIGQINSSSHRIPVIIGGDKKDIESIINTSSVAVNSGEIPIRELVRVGMKRDFKKITSGPQGEYIPIGFDVESSDVEDIEFFFKDLLHKLKLPVHFGFNGTVYRTKKMMGELSVILLISVLLLFFILTAQFNSLKLPLIILIEIPIDIAGTLLLLFLMGESLNIMSAIGIIVMTGIIINDSILKIDTINRLIKENGMGIMEAIKEGGRRRLRPIVMTSLTTILALVPFLFTNGMGVELQRPLAIAVIGGLGLGTIISLFFIPLAYYVFCPSKN